MLVQHTSILIFWEFMGSEKLLGHLLSFPYTFTCLFKYLHKRKVTLVTVISQQPNTVITQDDITLLFPMAACCRCLIELKLCWTQNFAWRDLLRTLRDGFCHTQCACPAISALLWPEGWWGPEVIQEMTIFSLIPAVTWADCRANPSTRERFSPTILWHTQSSHLKKMYLYTEFIQYNVSVPDNLTLGIFLLASWKERWEHCLNRKSNLWT